MTLHFRSLRQSSRRAGLLALALLLGVMVTSGRARAQSTVAINAGGAAQGSFAADAYYSGGSVSSTTDAINTSSVSGTAPEAVYQSERYGAFSYTIPNLTAGGVYTVYLHFAEIYWNSAGSRQFNVLINGTQVLTNFDIFAAAGGKDIAVVKSFTATANSSGAIAIQFAAGAADQPKVSGIQVVQGEPVLQINSGGGASGAWAADEMISGGSTASTTAAINTANVADPAPQSVYQTERYGAFTYNISNLEPGASYNVGLHFAEIYWTAAGKREFNVLINGTQVLTNFDIFAAAGGENIAVVKSFTATASSSGGITIQFTVGAADQPKVSGIEIRALQGAQPATVDAIAAGSGSAAFSWSADQDYSGGTAASYSNVVDTSQVANPAPQFVYQNERWGSFTYTIPNLTPGANYTVVLHFAEHYWTAPGQRQFNVLINGTQVLTNFDIVAAAGGAFIAVDKSFSATASGSGAITIDFQNGAANNPVVSGIQVLSSSSAKVTPVINWPTPAAVPVGTALSSTQLDAAATVNGSAIAGSYSYSPAAGTVMNTAGNVALNVTFTPSDTVDYNSATGSVVLDVTSTSSTCTTTINWATPAPITYGTALGSTQLDATASCNGSAVPGTFSYNPAAGTVLPVGTQTLNVQFTPTDTSSYTSASASVSITVNPAATEISVNAGGGASGAWAADEYFSGGSTASTTSAIDTSKVSNPAPQSVYQTERYGSSGFTYTVPGLTAGATYTVNLHFAEIYWTAAGQREFNVSINGQQVLTNFDIFAAAGGENIAIVKSFTTTADSNGNITIAFTVGAANYPKVSGIDVVSGGKLTPTINWPTPAPVPVGTALSSTQLDATATVNGSAVAGSFAYNPAAGTVMNTAGNVQLCTTFTPSDTNTYNSAQSCVTLNVTSSTASCAGDGSTVSGPWGTYNFPCGDYTYQSDEWNSTDPQTAVMSTSAVGFNLNANFGANDYTSASTAPKTYASIYFGCHWGTCTSAADTHLPIQESQLKTAVSSVNINTQGDVYANDDAYDIWFNQTPTTSGQPNGTEVMIWINHSCDASNCPQPGGSPVRTVTIDGMSWTVWVARFGSSPEWNVVSYVLNNPVTSVSNLNLIPIFTDATQEQAVGDASGTAALSPSWYLIDVEYGFEVWQGGQGLAVNSFSVTTN